MWQHIPYYRELIALIVISLIVLVIIYKTSKFKKYWRIRLFIALGSMIWFISKLLELGFVDLEIKLFWYKIQIISILIFSASLLIFSIYYSGREKWFNRAGRMLLWIIPLISAILLYLDNLQTLVIRNVEIKVIDSFLILGKVYSQWYWIIISYVFFLILVSIILLNVVTKRSNYRYQWQALISIMVLAVYPIIIVLLSLFNYRPYPYLDILPFTLATGCLVVSATIYRVKEEEVTDIDNSSVIDSVEDGIILLDKNNNVLFMNKAFKNYFNLYLNETVGKNIESVFPSLDSKLKSFDYDMNSYKEPKIFYLNGKTFELNISGLFNLLKRYVGRTIVLKDITEKKAAENINKESEEKYRTLFEKSSEGIFRYNIRDNKIDMNPALIKMLGYSNDKHIDYDHINEVLNIFKKDISYNSEENNLLQKHIERIDGSKIWVEISSNRDTIHNGDTIYNGIIRDITSKKSFEDKIRFLSFHDKLTGLYNRAFFEVEIKRLDNNRQLPLTIIISDIDGLKIINDAFGHETGDKLIKKIADIFKDCFRNEDIIARYGGDEFVTLLPATPVEEALKIIERIKITCKKESTRIFPLNISMGVATKEEISQDINSIIKAADDQMYRNKLTNKNSPHSSLIFSLEKALEERNFETVEHVRRMRDGVMSLGKELNLEESTNNDLRLLSTLHDIGKIGISDNIILKQGELNHEERKAVERHSEIGFRIAKTSNELSTIAKPILHHHEWWNGQGYPHRLKDKRIPFNSRIISIVDSYDAMTNDRPYRKAMSKDKAIIELRRCSETQFDPFLVEKFLNIC